ncbi:MAG TPA: peptide chain release factor N(5)-glutamine methyltransferase, partial [Pseudobdellovibrionaceae bacterium]|nr:peptide chain release factor N(5)-glutamine methyltransferase [Pseudobdellovibrionaceae bacterium]
EKTSQFFREKGFPSARLDAEILLAHGLGIERIRLYLDFDRELAPSELDRCREFVKRRTQGEPVAYIIGYKDFYNSRFKVTSDVLIPRPETEQIVEEAIEWCKRNELTNPRIVDLGTGSGCLGLSVLKEVPSARLLAVDVSAKALAVAKENAEALGLLDRVTFVEADAGDPASVSMGLEAAGFEEMDLLLSNPPYIAKADERVEKDVHRFEPHLALYAEEDGLSALKAWISLWRKYLGRPGISMMEMGTGQGEALKKHYSDFGFSDVQVLKDLAGHDRVIKGVQHG